MKEIKLTQGKVALVDDDDYDALVLRKWRAVNHDRNGRWYAFGSSGYGRGNTHTIRMHRIILSAPEGVDVDHINGNGLDNRKSNLRIATEGQNAQNRRKTECHTSSKYKGVCRRGNRWEARVMKNKKTYWLGTFETQIDAARAYDKKAMELFGEFAKTNL